MLLKALGLGALVLLVAIAIVAVPIGVLFVLTRFPGESDDTSPGIDIYNDIGREVEIWYDVDGVETLQRAVSRETTIPPDRVRTYRFDFPPGQLSDMCTDSPIIARDGDGVIAVIPPPACLGGVWLNLSRFPP